VNWFDRSATSHYSETAATVSDILDGAIAAAPFVLFANEIMRNDWRTITLMYMETWSFIGGTSMLSKGLIERYRPYVYNLNVPLDKKLSNYAKMSFFLIIQQQRLPPQFFSLPFTAIIIPTQN